MRESNVLRLLAAALALLVLQHASPGMAQTGTEVEAEEPAGQSAEDRSGQWHLSVYTGRAAKERLLDIITRYNTGFIDSYMVAAAPGFVHRETRRWRFEIEGQAVKHWGDQDHWEFNAAYIARWKPFIWDKYVDTSLAAGAGVSYALEVPPIEPRADRVTDDTSAKMLGYLMAEIEFAPPGDAPWAIFFRLHHRSGAKGLFKDVDGGSNFVTGGLRWQF